MTKATRTAAEAMTFLERQRLEPHPQNYALAWAFVTGGNAGIAKAVALATDGGVRISQGEADGIMAAHGLQTAPAEAVDDGREAVRLHMMRFADLASDQSAATTRLGQDLDRSVERLSADPALVASVGALRQRTLVAERGFSDAVAEIGRLRQDLEAARTDANVDALTGLANRRAIETLLAAQEAKGRARVIAVIDVDRFKRVNDTYGHAVGDRVLKGVAETLRETLGKHATAGRWGGEEFIAIFEGADLAGASAIVDDARKALCRRHFKLRENDVPLGQVSFSAGVAAGAGPAAEIIRVADGLLYRAKEEGRNQVLNERSPLPMEKAA